MNPSVLIAGICAKCGKRVVGENNGCTAMDQVFHIACFVCVGCGRFQLCFLYKKCINNIYWSSLRNMLSLVLKNTNVCFCDYQFFAITTIEGNNYRFQSLIVLSSCFELTQ